MTKEMVQIKLTRKMRPYNIGEVIGLPEDDARRMVADENAVFFSEPKAARPAPLADNGAGGGKKAAAPAEATSARQKGGQKGQKKMMQPPAAGQMGRMRQITKPANVLQSLLNKGAEAAAPAVAQAAATDAAVKEKED